MADGFHTDELGRITDTKGSSITIAEAETATGHVDRETLDALAEVAARFPRP